MCVETHFVRHDICFLVWHLLRTAVINPRRTCAAIVTVVDSVCLSYLLSHISPLECLFILKTLSRTQRTKKVKKFVGFLWNRSVVEIQHYPRTAILSFVGYFRYAEKHACAYQVSLTGQTLSRLWEGLARETIIKYTCTCSALASWGHAFSREPWPCDASANIWTEGLHISAFFITTSKYLW